MFMSWFLCSVMLFIEASAQTFDWNSIQPSQNFSWVGCYSGMECARLSVPLNYSDASQGDAAIAVARITSNATGSDHLGPIFFNPGGPGVSGVEEMLTVGPILASVNPQFDIVSFDPRGVSYSTPSVEFFTSDSEKALWLSTKTFDSNSSSDTIPRQVAQARLLGQLAKDRDNSGILAHVATDNVARDLLQMMEAYDQEKLQYWGISYGSLLGSTFATLFPDRVGRIVIDGVVDADDWFSNNFKDQFLDIDNEMQQFFNACFSAGPAKCDFYASSPNEISANLGALFVSILAQPLPAYAGSNAPYGLVDYDYLRNVVVRALYSPYNLFAPLASALAQLKAGNATGIYELIDPVLNSGLCASRNGTSVFPDGNEYEAEIAIQCADGSVVEDSVDDLRALMTSINSNFSGEVVALRAGCIGWQVHPQRFAGPVGANTSFPLMLIGNTFDPVTPLAAARKTSQAFPGSVILQQNSLGHTSFSASSICTRNAVRSYFTNGTLPQPGMVCAVESQLFPGSGASATDPGSGSSTSSFTGAAASTSSSASFDAAFNGATFLKRDNTGRIAGLLAVVAAATPLFQIIF